MSRRLCIHRAAGCALVAGLFLLVACSSDEPAPVPLNTGQREPGAINEAAAPAPTAAASVPLRDEIPAAELAAVMKENYRGLGSMERYEYAAAVEAFRDVHRRAPGWIPGSINLAIALLNDSGVKAEQAKKAGGETAPDNFNEALDLLAQVLERDPNNPYAHYSRGIILEQQGRLAEAHRHFERVTEIDPSDASAWYWSGSTLPDTENPSRPAGPKLAQEQIALFAKALERNPYLTPAIYKMAMTARFTEMARYKELIARWKEINPDRLESSPGPGDSAEKSYGEMGKYASVINPFPRENLAPKPRPCRFDSRPPRPWT